MILFACLFRRRCVCEGELTFVSMIQLLYHSMHHEMSLRWFRYIHPVYMLLCLPTSNARLLKNVHVKCVYSNISSAD